MKILATLSLFLLQVVIVFAQAPLVKQWDYRFGGTFTEELTSFQQTADGGYILGGRSSSGISGDKTELNRGPVSVTYDYWIVKVNASGIKQWDKRFGGTGIDWLFEVEQTTDGGYILGGVSDSRVGGDRTQPNWDTIGPPSGDYWVVKTDSAGVLLWDKCFGGEGNDWCTSLEQTTDGGYIFGGYSASNISGDRTQNNWGPPHTHDYWVVKTDALGNKQWDKRFGGISSDRLHSLQQTTDGGYILGGESASGISGDKSQSAWALDTYDYWIVKIDASGTKQWDKRFGGLNGEKFYSIKQSNDGGYIMGGISCSDSSGDKTQVLRDTNIINTQGAPFGDFWIVKTDALGNKQWDKKYGGLSPEDEFGNVSLTSDGGYLLAGVSYSSSSGEKSEANLGAEQLWVIKTDASGNPQWDKTMFTFYHEEFCIATETPEGCYVMAGYNSAAIGGDKTQAPWGNGVTAGDYWLIKFCDTTRAQQIPLQTNLASTNASCLNPCSGTASITLTNGTAPYQYVWQPGNYSTASVNNLCSGTYAVTVTDALNNSATGSVTITQPNGVTAGALANGSTCGRPNGTVSVAAV
ncbi:MAG: SprB repeat-containing protein, partial [Bacteroidota bacterium]